MLYDLDVEGAANLAAAQAAPLFTRLMALNEENSYTRASFSEKDVAYCIELAQMLSKQSAINGKLSANK